MPSDLIVLCTTPADARTELTELRALTIVPILFLLDQPPEDALLVSLLDGGADLVLASPYNDQVLLAQVRVLLRRAAAVPLYNLRVLEVGNVRLDPTQRTVQINGSHQRLSHLELRLLRTLMLHPGEVLVAEQLLHCIWGEREARTEDQLRGLVHRLRQKIEADPASPRYLCTAAGGYRFSTA